MLFFVGLGYSKRHITLEAIEALKNSETIYVDTYTSLFEDSLEIVENINPSAKVIYASRKDLEGENIAKIVNEASSRNIAIAVPGDPFIATTHDAILSEAMKRGISFKVINGLSILTLAYSKTGLQTYRFGKITTLVYPKYFKPFSTIEFIHENLRRNLHTLVLLELRVEESIAMSIADAVSILKDLDERRILANRLAFGLARLGWSDEKICVDHLYELGNHSYPPPPHSIIVVAKPDPVEEEIISYWMKKC